MSNFSKTLQSRENRIHPPSPPSSISSLSDLTHIQQESDALQLLQSLSTPSRQQEHHTLRTQFQFHDQLGLPRSQFQLHLGQLHHQSQVDYQQRLEYPHQHHPGHRSGFHFNPSLQLEKDSLQQLMTKKRDYNGVQRVNSPIQQTLKPIAPQHSQQTSQQTHPIISAIPDSTPTLQHVNQSSDSVSKSKSSRQTPQLRPAQTTRRLLSPAVPTSNVKAKKDSVNAKDYWNNPGMKTLVNWITEPGNYTRLNDKNAISGQKPADVKRQLAKRINEQEGTDWTPEQLKTKLQYLTRRYDQARKIKNSTGEGDTETETLKKRIEDICPVFDRLSEVFETDLDRNPLIGWDSITALDSFDHDKEEETDDLTSEESESDSSESNGTCMVTNGLINSYL